MIVEVFLRTLTPSATVERMAEITIKVPGFRCERCGHEWIARKPRNAAAAKGKKAAKPRQCPKCKSAWWDTPPGA